jgi:hypothetical protein
MDLIYASLFIWGIKCLFSEGFIFYFDKSHWPSWVKKPLLTCPPCMSSVYGTLWFLYMETGGVMAWVQFCVMLCGLNYFITQLISKERIIIEE